MDHDQIAGLITITLALTGLGWGIYRHLEEEDQ